MEEIVEKPEKKKDIKSSAVIETNKEMPITYMSMGKEITLTPAMVRTLSNNNRFITDDEIVLFMEMCRFSGLNPFMKEAYLIKFDEKKPAQQVVSLAAVMRVADENPAYDGMDDGIVVKTSDGKIIERVGCILYPGETILGGWAKAFRKDRNHPAIAKLSIKEFSKGQALWVSSAALMINKCAKVAALRKLFPSQFVNTYTEEELQMTGATEPIKQEPVNREKVYDIEVEDKDITYDGEVVAEISSKKTKEDNNHPDIDVDSDFV